MSQQVAFEYLRHGQTPFFRLPLAKVAERGPRAYEGADAVVLGVPFDGGTTYQPGARFAPFHVRRVSALVQSYHPVHRVDVFGALSVLDGGNVAIPPFAPAMVRELVQAEVAAVIGARAIPFVVGGDHSVALPVLRALAAAHGPVSVVHVDAHLDTSGPETWMEPFHHGTPFRHAIAEGLIERGQLHQIGIRATWAKKDEADVVLGHGGHIHTADDVASRGIASVMAQVVKHVGARPVYVSFDVDGVDPAFAPGTGTPVPGGLSSREALALLRGLAGCNLVGMDLVEIAPELDHADMTCHLGAHLLFEGLALVALSRVPR
jgi:agmatinase